MSPSGPIRSSPPPAGDIVVRTEPVGGGPLTVAAISGTTPPGWYAARPRHAGEWEARAASVRSEHGGARWLDELGPAIEASGPAGERLRLAAERGVVVTTGQQPGLFGGPIYTWSKAVSALALADALERAIGMPVAPLFWAATDDTDFSEASTTWVSLPGGAEPITVLPHASPGTVLSLAGLDDLGAAFATLATAAGSARYAGALEAVRIAYGVPLPGTPAIGAQGRAAGRNGHGLVTAGGSYVQLLRALLAPLGVAVLDAGHEAVRRRAFPVLRTALERADSLATALAERSRAITAAGYESQVRAVERLSTVFIWEEPSRDGGAARGGEGAIKSRVPLARARDLAVRARPGELSPNVLLRPVVERAIIPTVAYVAGPGEIAYFAQSSAVADVLQLPVPLAVPRWSCTLIEAATSALMTRYSVTIDELREPQRPEQRVARAALPAALHDALEALGAEVDRKIDAVSESDTEGLVGPAALEGARAQLRHRVERLERRFLAAQKQRELMAMRDLATIRGALRPNGRPQERMLNFIPFLARGGPALFSTMRQEANRHGAALVGPVGDTSSAPR